MSYYFSIFQNIVRVINYWCKMYEHKFFKPVYTFNKKYNILKIKKLK